MYHFCSPNLVASYVGKLLGVIAPKAIFGYYYYIGENMTAEECPVLAKNGDCQGSNAPHFIAFSQLIHSARMLYDQIPYVVDHALLLRPLQYSSTNTCLPVSS